MLGVDHDDSEHVDKSHDDWRAHDDGRAHDDRRAHDDGRAHDVDHTYDDRRAHDDGRAHDVDHAYDDWAHDDGRAHDVDHAYDDWAHDDDDADHDGGAHDDGGDRRDDDDADDVDDGRHVYGWADHVDGGGHDHDSHDASVERSGRRIDAACTAEARCAGGGGLADEWRASVHGLPGVGYRANRRSNARERPSPTQGFRRFLARPRLAVDDDVVHRERLANRGATRRTRSTRR